MKTIQLFCAGLLIIISGLWLSYTFLSTETVVMDDKLRKSAPGKFIKLSDGVTHYKLEGPEDGEVIVLVAGATLPLWVWKGLDERLIKAGYRVLSYDLYGRGYSDRPHIIYNQDLYYRQLKELTDKLIPNKQVHMINLAFGNLISSEFIVRQPGRVKSMATVGPDGFGLEAKASTRLLLALPGPVRDYVFSALGTKILMSRLPNYSKDEKLVKELQELYRPTLNWIGFKHSVLSSVLHMPITDARELFQKVTQSKVPVQLIWGKSDIVTPFPGEVIVRESFPHGEIRLLDSLGHLPHYENPDEVSKVIIDFIKRSKL